MKTDIISNKTAKTPLERAQKLVTQMTLKEKISQLQAIYVQDFIEDEKVMNENGIGGIAFERYEMSYSVLEEVRFLNRIQKYCVEHTRLGIPALVHAEALHGLCLRQGVSFPQAIGLAATWDQPLMQKISGGIAQECRSRGIRQVLSPTVDLARDARWGRCEETYGEDPYLASRMAVQFCKGFEENNVITTPKHFVANFGEGGRDSGAVFHSEYHLRNLYFQPYEACIREAGSRSIMASYNSLNGVPTGLNRWLLTDVLREEWGFDGCVVTDYGLMERARDLHRVSPDLAQIASRAIHAGLEREIPSRVKQVSGFNHLEEAAEQGLLDEKDLDQAVIRVLKQKFELGLFENPYLDEEAAAAMVQTEAMRELSYHAAGESFVLLKNKDNILPISKNTKHIGVIGNIAKKPRLGGYSSWGMPVTSILDGLRTYENRCEIHDLTEKICCDDGLYSTIPSSHLLSTDGKTPGLHGTYYHGQQLSGTAEMELDHSEIDCYWQCGPFELFAPFSVRWNGFLYSEKDTICQICVDANGGIRLTIDGTLLIDRYADPISGQEFCFVKLQAGKKHPISLEYCSEGHEAHVALRWKNETDNADKLPLELLDGLDLALIVAGIREGESKDRSHLGLEPETESLIREVSSKVPTVVLLSTGGAITMQNWENDVNGIMMIWYPGQEGGKAVADALFGKINPAGRLPVTFPRDVAQAPLCYDQYPAGRTAGYVDISDTPLYPFGYGLSYSSFEYSGLQISPEHPDERTPLIIQVDVKNTSDRNGDEVVQLYMHDVYSSVVTPKIRLIDFQRIHLKAGEKKTVTFIVTTDKLRLLNEQMQWVLEDGEFEFMIGRNCEDLPCRASIMLMYPE